MIRMKSCHFRSSVTSRPNRHAAYVFHVFLFLTAEVCLRKGV